MKAKVGENPGLSRLWGDRILELRLLREVSTSDLERSEVGVEASMIF